MRAAAKKAAIEVEEAALEQLQEVEELKLHQKKVQLSLRTKLAIAKAEEEVYTLNEYNKYSMLFKVVSIRCIYSATSRAIEQHS